MIQNEIQITGTLVCDKINPEKCSPKTVKRPFSQLRCSPGLSPKTIRRPFRRLSNGKIIECNDSGWDETDGDEINGDVSCPTSVLSKH